jgi:hypothetical protein
VKAKQYKLRPPNVAKFLGLLLLVGITFFVVERIGAQAPPFEWAAQMGGPLASDGASDVAVDYQGNVYATGSFFNTANFGGVFLTNFLIGGYGPHGVFVAKYDSRGAFTWARGGGVGNYSVGSSADTDASGNIIVVGQFYGQLSFGSSTLSSVATYPHYDAFLVKFSSTGNALWTRAITGSLIKEARSVAVAADGSVSVAGSFAGNASFGNTNLTSLGSYDVYLANYSAGGTLLWVRQVGSTNSYGDNASQVASDRVGNRYLLGYLSGFARIGQTLFTNEGTFVAKYDPSGMMFWARQLPDSTNHLGVRPLSVDSSGNYLVGGSTKNDLLGFVTKLDTNGNAIWMRSCGNDVTDAVMDEAGNVFVGGNFYDGNTFGFTNLVSSGTWQGFLAAYDRDGGPLWARKVCPTNTLNSVVGVALDNSRNLLVAGSFWADCLCDTTYLSGTNNYDAYVAKLASAPPVLPTILTQPQDQTVVAGVTATFGVLAAGTSPLRFQWRSNGTKLLEGTNATLALVSVQASQAGAYDVVIGNAAGSITSAVAVLTVEHSLTTRTNGRGLVTRAPNQASFLPGTTVTVTASPLPGYGFIDWSGDADGSLNPLNVTMTSNKTIIANFASTALVISVQGDGSVGKLPDRPFYDVGQQVTLTASSGRWFGFTSWSDGEIMNPRVITIGANNSYTAMFSPTTAVETLTFGNVSRTAPIGMPALFVDGEFVVINEVSRLDLAEASMLTTFPNGSIFYTLDGSEPSFAASLYGGPFVLHRSATVRAVAYEASFLNSWEADPVEVIIEPTFAVNLSTAGGGTVSVLPTAASYRSNTVVTPSAQPAPGWTFLQWLGDASGTNSTMSMRVMNRDLCVDALFGTTLATTAVGSGSVIEDPAAALYPYGTVVRLTAMPQSGNYFGAWGNAVMSTNNPLLFTVTNANPTVSCAFGSLSAGQVALTVLVDGRGRVTTSPRGNRFPSGQSIRLTATADADQEFLGWTGDATGTTTNLTVALTQSKVITANFTKRPRLSLGPCLGGWREEGFQLTLTGEFGGHYRIEQSSALENWSTLVSFTNTYGIWQMIDTTALNNATRFYRAVEEP